MSTVWLIPAFPLAGALINMLFGRVTGRRASLDRGAGAGRLVPGLVLGGGARVVERSRSPTTLFTWIVAGDFETGVTAYVDALTAVMLLVVTGVGFLIHLYSIGYMHDDPGYARFFAYLNLFVFSMTMLVLAGNFLLLYVFWEAVGLCSYLLIGFWYTRPAAAQAGKKAFIVNRVGDFGFGLGIMWLWTALGTLDYAGVFKGVATLPPATATGIALLLFMGACGKSAQLPLHTWLPDAMEGPTPVSALIHAATMVTAGVYMVARSHALFERSGVALEVVAWVGAVTAIFAATIGLVQTDIKRVLAYSTVSQLGYMFAAVGLGAYVAGIVPPRHPRLLQGAALPRRGQRDPRAARRAGSAEDGRARLQDADHRHDHVDRRARAGRRCRRWPDSSPRTRSWPPRSTGEHTPIFLLLLVGAFLTAFYTFRLLFLAFSGSPRMSKEVLHHAHESPWVMTVPLVVLLAADGGGRLRVRVAVRTARASRSCWRRCSPSTRTATPRFVAARVGARVRGRPGAGHVPLPADAGEGRHGRAAPHAGCARCCSTPTTSMPSTTG